MLGILLYFLFEIRNLNTYIYAGVSDRTSFLYLIENLLLTSLLYWIVDFGEFM